MITTVVWHERLFSVAVCLLLNYVFFQYIKYCEKARKLNKFSNRMKKEILKFNTKCLRIKNTVKIDANKEKKKMYFLNNNRNFIGVKCQIFKIVKANCLLHCVLLCKNSLSFVKKSNFSFKYHVLLTENY